MGLTGASSPSTPIVCVSDSPSPSVAGGGFLRWPASMQWSLPVGCMVVWADSEVRVCDPCFMLVTQEKKKDVLFASLRPAISKGELNGMERLITFLKPG